MASGDAAMAVGGGVLDRVAGRPVGARRERGRRPDVGVDGQMLPGEQLGDPPVDGARGGNAVVPEVEGDGVAVDLGVEVGEPAEGLQLRGEGQAAADPAVVERLLAEAVADQMQLALGGGPTARWRTSPRWPRARSSRPHSCTASTSTSVSDVPRKATPVARPGACGAHGSCRARRCSRGPSARRPSAWAGRPWGPARPRPAGDSRRPDRRRASDQHPSASGPRWVMVADISSARRPSSAASTRRPGSNSPAMPHISGRHAGTGAASPATASRPAPPPSARPSLDHRRSPRGVSSTPVGASLRRRSWHGRAGVWQPATVLDVSEPTVRVRDRGGPGAETP